MNGDYKVVKIDIYKNKWPYNVEVYSLKKDSWTWIGDAIPSRLSIVMPAQKAMVNGSVHWLASKESYRQSILSFDMVDKVFREIMFSDYMHPDCNYSLGSLHECLSIFANIYAKEGGLEVWVMKEYGVVESWSKQYVIRLYSDFGNHITYYPFGFTQTGNLVMEKIQFSSTRNISSLILYDPRSNKDYFEDSEIAPLSISRIVFSYVESLVSVMPGAM
ncbi:hypothetical protein F0562_025791 [Nyssa sinensis]|uniref:F-box associated beta-propeller type 1 domain-containing protein n=1 Tax=Nyssa sinensis TaxID=561372 RepID=A0A5J5B8S9_9ASTE|nr:hypothetical protein F0562_025791 [Nyssa sinensis]